METKKGFNATVSMTIAAPIQTVWNAIVDPAMIKQYLFGTEVISDWQVGSTITYKGVWQGKTYEDKGEILQLVPEKLFQSTYWSSMSGMEDKPENYATVTYSLSEKDGQTELTLVQDNNINEEAAKHSEQNWHAVLDSLKKLLEQ